jgi:hypothetical protein
MDPGAPETIIMIDKKVTFAVATGATNTCNQRFGRLGTKAIVAMAKKEIVLGIPKLEEDEYKSFLCFGCALGKFGFTKAFSLINKSKALKFYKCFCDHTPGTSSTKELRTSGAIMLRGSFLRSLENTSVIKALF